MLEYIVIKVPLTKLNNKHHAGDYMSRTNDQDLFKWLYEELLGVSKKKPINQ